MDTPFYFSVFLCLLRVSVCVVCVRLARQGHGKSSTSAATSSTLRVRLSHKNLYSYLLNVRTPSIQLYIVLTFFPCLHLSPKKLHNFKKNFRLFHATSPKHLYNCCANFST